MKAAVLHAPYDIRVEQLPDPQIAEPTDAIIRIAAACVCGSDLWPYRGIQGVDRPTPMGHEYCGVVEEVGRESPAPAGTSATSEYHMAYRLMESHCSSRRCICTAAPRRYGDTCHI